MDNLKKIIITAFTLSFPAAIYATPVAITDTAFCSGCFINASYSLSDRLILDFAKYDPQSGTYTDTWLIGHTLHAGSNSVFDDYYGEHTGETVTITTPYTGHIWMMAPKQLDLSESNIFNIYTDKIIPDPDSYNPAYQPSTWSFGMTASDAIDGTGTYFQPEYGDYLPTSGDLSVLDGVSTCIECSIDVTLNLVGLQYSASGYANPFVMGDSNLLLEYTDSYYSYNVTRSFIVSPIPVPAAGWLLASGTIGLLVLARRKP